MGDDAGVFGERKRNQVHSGWDVFPVLLNPGATGRGREKQSRLQINTFTWETKMVALFFLPAVALRCTNPHCTLHTNVAVEGNSKCRKAE